MKLYIIEAKVGEGTLRRTLVNKKYEELPWPFEQACKIAREDVLSRVPEMRNAHLFQVITAYIAEMCAKYGFEETEDVYVYEGEFRDS